MAVILTGAPLYQNSDGLSRGARRHATRRDTAPIGANASLTLALLALLLCLFQGHAHAASAVLLDLRSAMPSRPDDSRPLMIEFAASHCSYCELLEAEILRPMALNPETHRRVLMHRIDLDSNQPIVDFDGTRTDANRLARRYAIELTPTLLFLDRKGQEISRLVGVYSLDYFGGLIEQRIDEAASWIRSRQQ